MNAILVEAPIPYLDVGQETTELERVDEQLNQLTDAAQIFQEEGLTQSLAIESTGVMGTTLMNAYFSHSNKTKRNQIATEGFVQKFKDMIVHAYKTILDLIRKCINWIKGLFRRNKVDPNKSKETIRMEGSRVQKAMRAAEAAGDLDLKGLIKGHQLDNDFVSKLTKPEFALLQSGSPYQTKVKELTHTLEGSKTMVEIEKTMGELDKWYTEKLAEAKNLEANKQTGSKKTSKAPKFSQFHETISKDAHGLATTGREETDQLFEQYYELRDLIDKLPEPSKLEAFYDVSQLLQTVLHVQGTTYGQHTVLMDWEKNLERLEKDLDAASAKTQAELDAINESGELTILSEVHQEYFNALNTIPQRIMNVSQIIAKIYQCWDAETRVFYKTLQYIHEAVMLVPEEKVTDEIDELQIATKKALTNLRELF